MLSKQRLENVLWFKMNKLDCPLHIIGLKTYHNNPLKLVTSVDAGKWFDEIEWHDFLRD